MNVRFLNLSVCDETRKVYLQRIDNVLKHGQLILGPEVKEFETEVQNYCSIANVVGVSSGTDALYLALRALDIGAGDEVVTSSISFVASANAISLTGAKPVFADVNDDFNMNTQSLERLINENTKAIMPVHYGGKIADMDSINEIAQKYSLKVVEDASQAFGAMYDQKFAGTMSDIGAVSLNSMKILAALGDAGIVMTDGYGYAEKLQMLRYNGLNAEKICELVSTNAKMDTIQAAVLLERLKTLDALIEKRREIADIYSSRLSSYVKTPSEDEKRKNVYFTYTILSEQRDRLFDFLTHSGIEVKIYHTNLMDETAYKNHRGECVNARRLSKQKLALPCHENMTQEEVEYVVAKTQEFFEGSK